MEKKVEEKEHVAVTGKIVIAILFCAAAFSSAGADMPGDEAPRTGVCRDGLPSDQRDVRVKGEAVSAGDLTEQAAGLCDEKRYDAAEPLLKRAIQAESGFAEAHYRLAIVYLKTARPAEAAQEYLKTAGLDEKLARELRMLNPMFSLSGPAKGVATESGFITAPGSDTPAGPRASDGVEVR
ncbi:MAG TPA: tetratricopeptide repeat protein [Candidatus Ozemobacteraceae bacterium]|nr:tetratricopeptide repeat protein [Candidatus Ozemobacteraceae bacterium]